MNFHSHGSHKSFSLARFELTIKLSSQNSISKNDTYTALGFRIFSKGSQKSLSLARFELTIICIGALFVVTKWYMIIEYKHHNQSWKHKFLNSQTVQTIHHSQQGPGRGEFWLSRVFVFLCSSTCIPNSKIELECIIKK